MIKQYILLFLIIVVIAIGGYYTYRTNSLINQQIAVINGAIQQLQKTNEQLRFQVQQAKVQSDIISGMIQQLKQQITDIIDYQPIDSVKIVQYIDVKNYQYYGQIDYGDSYININEEKLSRFIGVTKHLQQQNKIKDQIINEQDSLITVKNYQINNLQKIVQNQQQINRYLRQQLQLQRPSSNWKLYGGMTAAIITAIIIF